MPIVLRPTHQTLLSELLDENRPPGGGQDDDHQHGLSSSLLEADTVNLSLTSSLSSPDKLQTTSLITPYTNHKTSMTTSKKAGNSSARLQTSGCGRWKSVFFGTAISPTVVQQHHHHHHHHHNDTSLQTIQTLSSSDLSTRTVLSPDATTVGGAEGQEPRQISTTSSSCNAESSQETIRRRNGRGFFFSRRHAVQGSAVTTKLSTNTKKMAYDLKDEVDMNDDHPACGGTPQSTTTTTNTVEDGRSNATGRYDVRLDDVMPLTSPKKMEELDEGHDTTSRTDEVESVEGDEFPPEAVDHDDCDGIWGATTNSAVAAAAAAADSVEGENEAVGTQSTFEDHDRGDYDFMVHASIDYGTVSNLASENSGCNNSSSVLPQKYRYQRAIYLAQCQQYDQALQYLESDPLNHLNNNDSAALITSSPLRLPITELSYQIHVLRAQLLGRMGRYEDSLACYQSLLQVLKEDKLHVTNRKDCTPIRVDDDDGTSVRFHHEVPHVDRIKLLYACGQLSMILHDYESALSYYQEELKETRKLLSRSTESRHNGPHLSIARIYHQLAHLYQFGMGDLNLALQSLQQAWHVERALWQELESECRSCMGSRSNHPTASSLAPRAKTSSTKAHKAHAVAPCYSAASPVSRCNCCPHHESECRQFYQQLRDTQLRMGRIFYLQNPQNLDKAIRWTMICPTVIPLVSPKLDPST